MSYRSRALPSAKKERQWLCETYGTKFGQQLDAWMTWIVGEATTTPSHPTFLLLEKILTDGPSPIEKTWVRFWSCDFKDQLSATLAFIRTRRPPWEFFVVTKRFFNDRYWITIDAYIEVNHPKREVVFAKLENYGDGPGSD
jgi:hypothetical protein